MKILFQKMTDQRGVGTLITDETELTTSNFDFFTAPLVENVLQNGYFVELNPINVLTNNGPFEFHIARDPDHYIELPYTTLSGKLRVTKTNNEDLESTDAVGICNMFPHSLFKQIEIEVEGKQINDITSSTYPLKAFIEKTLSYDRSAINTHLRMEGVQRDDYGKEEVFAISEADATSNKGYVRRRGWVNAKDYYFNMIIHADFFQLQRNLLPNTNVVIKFIRNDDNYSLMSATSIAKIAIKDLKLTIRKVKISEDEQRKCEMTLQKEPAIYPITQSKIKTFLISSGIKTTNITNILNGILPQQIIIGFLSHTSFNGNVNSNPFFFRHFNLNYLNLKINGKPVHPKPLQPDYSAGDYLREYRLLFQNTGAHHGNFCLDIKPEDFVNNCNFYPFDFTHIYAIHNIFIQGKAVILI